MSNEIPNGVNRSPGSMDPIQSSLGSDIEREQLELKKELDETVSSIVGEEMKGRGGFYHKRGGPGFGDIGNESFYDFIRVEEDPGESRLILVIFNNYNTNWWNPEGLFENQTMYPIGTDKAIVYDKFRKELEEGMVPDVVHVQTSERSSEEDDRRWDFYQTVCIEVNNQEKVARVEWLVEGLDTKGILVRRPEEAEKILERIENDPNLVSKSDFTFDYLGIRDNIGISGEDFRKFIREKYWSGEENNELHPLSL